MAKETHSVAESGNVIVDRRGLIAVPGVINDMLTVGNEVIYGIAQKHLSNLMSYVTLSNELITP